VIGDMPTSQEAALAHRDSMRGVRGSMGAQAPMARSWVCLRPRNQALQKPTRYFNILIQCHART
jgi:hypothetical protein